MVGRRTWVKSACMAALAWLPVRGVLGQEENGPNDAEFLDESNIPELKEQLKKGLRAVTPEQHVFVNLVVAAVNQRKIPRAMVALVYAWALERNPRMPFPYFQFAMRILARRRGVKLP